MGQCSRAEIQSHLEHYDIGAASSQINALCNREILQESRRERERSEKRATDLDIITYSVVWENIPCHSSLKTRKGGFPGGAVVENLPANAGDTGSSLGLGRSHMPRSN